MSERKPSEMLSEFMNFLDYAKSAYDEVGKEDKRIHFAWDNYDEKDMRAER